MGRSPISHSLECLGVNAISTRSVNTWESSKEDVTLVTWLAIHQCQRLIVFNHATNMVEETFDVEFDETNGS